MKLRRQTDCYIVLPCSHLMPYRPSLGFLMMQYYHISLHPMVRPRLHPGLRRPPEPYLGPYAALFLVHPDIETKSAFAPLLYFSSYFLIFILFNCHFFDSANHLGSSLFSHYRSHVLFGSPPWSLPPPAPPDLMDPPPTGLLAGSTAPPPREAVFNPYRLPVSPPPGNIHPQPQRQPGFTGWFALRPGPLRHFAPTR